MQTSDATYNINAYKLARWLTPKANRKPGFIVLIKALIFPLFFLHDRFVRYIETKNYQLTITTQVAWLERLLNDRYDSTSRRIYITDAEWHLPIFLFQEEELQPMWINKDGEGEPAWLYTESEAGEIKDDFVVFVHVDIIMNDAEMRSYLDQYKLFGTKYKIQRYV